MADSITISNFYSRMSVTNPSHPFFGQPAQFQTAHERMRTQLKPVRGKLVRWNDFPLQTMWREVVHVEPYQVRREGNWVTRNRRFTIDTPYPAFVKTFIGTLDEYREEDDLTGRKKDTYFWYKPKVLFFKWLCPFHEENEKLILSPAKYSIQGDGALVLMDKALEEGMQLDKDFSIQRISRFISPISDDMRLFLATNLKEWAEVFDLYLETGLSVRMNWSSKIDFDPLAPKRKKEPWEVYIDEPRQT